MWYIVVGLVYEILNIVTAIFVGFSKKEFEDEFERDLLIGAYEGNPWSTIAGMLFRIFMWPISVVYTSYITIKHETEA